MDERDWNQGGKNVHFMIDMLLAVSERTSDFLEPVGDLGRCPLEFMVSLGSPNHYQQSDRNSITPNALV